VARHWPKHHFSHIRLGWQSPFESFATGLLAILSFAMPPLSRKAGWDKPDAHQGNAKGRVDHHAIRRILGDVAEPTTAVAAPAGQCHHRSDRQVHSVVSADAP
jgi:hypothetical protein